MKKMTKKILCTAMALAMCASAALFTGCGCNDGFNPGYKVEPTEPDLTNGDFGFFIVNSNELMVTQYTGSDTDIVIPESYNNYEVTVIGASLFYGADIESVTIPSSVKEIKDYAFASCHSLTKVTLSEGLETLGNNVFFNCDVLKEITLPSTITDLGMRTFSGSSVNNVVLPDSGSLTEIDEYVFYQCRELTDITIPACVTTIAENAFSDCKKDVTIHGESDSYAQSYVKDYGESNNLTFAATSTAAQAATSAAE